MKFTKSFSGSKILVMDACIYKEFSVAQLVHFKTLNHSRCKGQALIYGGFHETHKSILH